jgi:hypothetical protein
MGDRSPQSPEESKLNEFFSHVFDMNEILKMPESIFRCDSHFGSERGFFICICLTFTFYSTWGRLVLIWTRYNKFISNVKFVLNVTCEKNYLREAALDKASFKPPTR